MTWYMFGFFLNNSSILYTVSGKKSRILLKRRMIEMYFIDCLQVFYRARRQLNFVWNRVNLLGVDFSKKKKN